LACDKIEGPVAAEIVQVIDGGTVLVEATPWPQQTMKVYVRIRGIDAPQMHSTCADARRAGVDARHAPQELSAG
jgi:micrococcal nuclease